MFWNTYSNCDDQLHAAIGRLQLWPSKACLIPHCWSHPSLLCETLYCGEVGRMVVVEKDGRVSAILPLSSSYES